MKYLEIMKKFIVNNKIALICGVGLFGLVALYPVDYTEDTVVFKAKIEEVQKEINEINKEFDDGELKDLVEEIELVKKKTEALKKSI